VKDCGTSASSLSASVALGGETGLMGSFSFASGERAMTGETGALAWGANVSALMRCIEGT
jgi:hypothetical protein